jgi:hypothetical protein
MHSGRLLNKISDLCVSWLGLWVSFLMMVRYKDAAWQLEWRHAISVCINKMFAYPHSLIIQGSYKIKMLN